jgi:hypothetical protein
MTHHPSFGVQLSWDPAGGTAYTAINHVKDMTVPAFARANVEVTDHDSPDGFDEFLPTTTNAGALAFQVALDPNDSTHVGGPGTGLVGAFQQGGCTVASWKVELVTCGGSTATWTADGFPDQMTWNYPVKGELTADFNVKLTGRPVLVVA